MKLGDSLGGELKSIKNILLSNYEVYQSFKDNKIDIFPNWADEVIESKKLKKNFKGI